MAINVFRMSKVSGKKWSNGLNDQNLILLELIPLMPSSSARERGKEREWRKWLVENVEKRHPLFYFWSSIADETMRGR